MNSNNYNNVVKTIYTSTSPKVHTTERCVKYYQINQYNIFKNKLEI